MLDHDRRFNELIVSVLIAIGSICAPSLLQCGQLMLMHFQLFATASPSCPSMWKLDMDFSQKGQRVMGGFFRKIVFVK